MLVVVGNAHPTKAIALSNLRYNNQQCSAWYLVLGDAHSTEKRSPSLI